MCIKRLYINLFISIISAIFSVYQPVSAHCANLPAPNLQKKQINVLSLDGGGVKSITSLKILEYIEKQSGKKVTDLFDVVSGTSSGGILALYLTAPDPKNPSESQYSATDIINIFQNDTRKIFKPKRISKVVPTSILQLVRPGYENANVERVFKERFKDVKVSDLVVNTIITSYDSEDAVPFVFASYDSKTNTALVKDAAIATSSAPFYFSPLCYNDKDDKKPVTLIDGGIISKNPSLITYFELKKLYPNAQINMLSLGSGLQDKKNYNYNRMRKWGFVQYVVPMISFMLDGGCNTVDYQMKQLIPSNEGKGSYYRFQIPLNSRVDGSNNKINDTSDKNMTVLKGIASKYIDEHKAELDKMIEQLEAKKEVAI